MTVRLSSCCSWLSCWLPPQLRKTSLYYPAMFCTPAPCWWSSIPTLQNRWTNPTPTQPLAPMWRKSSWIGDDSTWSSARNPTLSSSSAQAMVNPCTPRSKAVPLISVPESRKAATPAFESAASKAPLLHSTIPAGHRLTEGRTSATRLAPPKTALKSIVAA
jgi:hypothetical protein